MTTTAQRQAWEEVHKALIEYIVNFGPIEVKQGDQSFSLNDCLYFTNCGQLVIENS